MKCDKCGAEYGICKKCGVGHYHGSSNAEHFMNCSLNGGFFKPNDGVRYPTWEAPDGKCPKCWHKENPDKDNTKPVEWVAEKIMDIKTGKE